MIGLALAHVACDDLENHSSMAIGDVSPSLSMQSPAVAFLASKVAKGEMLIAASEAYLPLTNRTFFEGKFLTPNNTVIGRAYTKIGVLVDGAAERKAEQAAHRGKYGAWSASDLQQLKGIAASQQVTASLWVGFFVPDSAKTLASVAPLAAAAKAPVNQAMAKGVISTLWDDPHSPLLLVKGTPAAILALGFHSAVDSAQIVTGPQVQALGVPGDGQEKIDAHLPALVSSQGSLTSDSVILQWDMRLPATEVTEHVPHPRDRSHDRMAYVPFSVWDNNYEYLNVPCYGNEGYTVEILPFWGTSYTTAKVGVAFMGTWE